MIYILIVAVLGAGIFCFTQYRKKKFQSVEKDALQLAWERRDFEAYLSLLNEKIEKTTNKKEKSILSTLKMQVYILQKDWQKMDALKKKVRTKELPKKIRVTFISQYIMGLCLSDRPQMALKWMEIEEPLLTEAEANGTYKLYINTLKGLKAFYHKNYEESKGIFTELLANGIKDDFYAPLFREYLHRIEAETTITE